MLIHNDMPHDKLLMRDIWQNEDLTNKKVLVRLRGGISGERKAIGIGDVFLFIRFVNKLRERGAQVVIEVHRSLEKIIKRNGYQIAHENESYDYQVPLISLPYIIGTKSPDLSNVLPYICYDEIIKKQRAKELNPKTTNVGISWRASNLPPLNRNIPFNQFLDVLAKIAKEKNITYYNMQGDLTQEELEQLPEDFPLVTLEGFDKNNNAFEDSAALIDLLDFCMFIDSSVLSLAGAMGSRKTFAILPADNDWRWGIRENSDWFPTLMLIRQREDEAKKNDWSRLLLEVGEKIAKKS
ncbi:hypothetical protein HYX58_02355 [Candidatus Dependentiae bacterium]|nr:hypothetical protein [Candidatus Dependentiae bacterium]